MIRSESSSSSHFDRPKLLLFKFLAHQIHPFAYAVNTFLQPALNDCQGLIVNNPAETFNVLLSLSQTFTRFAPESELIYDDIQQFAAKLKDAIDRCFARLDPKTIEQSSQLLDTARQSLAKIIQQRSTENTTYTDMYKNMTAVLTNLEKINSLPMEIQTITNRQETIMTNNGSMYNGYQNQKSSSAVVTPPPGIRPISATALPSQKVGPSSAISLNDQMKNLSVSSQPVSATSGLSDYEVADTNTQSFKKPTTQIASFPPRQTTSSFTNDTSINGSYPSSSVVNGAIKKDYRGLPSKANVNGQTGISHHQQQRDTPISTFSNDGSIRFGNTSGTRTKSATSSIHDDWNDDNETSRTYPLNTWRSAIDSAEQSRLDQVKTLAHPHVTDEYFQEFSHKQNRPALCGELSMTFGKPQSGPKTNCMPIGVGLSYDELTLLSCDVHRDAQHVRLFDIQTGRLRHTISSNQQMKFHRPGAVMSNARNSIFIVERDSIYVTEPDGRYIRTISHRSIKQLYGIASFRDRYILTIDSKSIDSQSAESCRLLLFDPNNGQLVFEQNIGINRQAETALKQQYVHHIQGKVLHESTSKPRFVAVHNDSIYIADLGRSLIYGTNLRNQFDFSCTNVFGGHGRANGEMHDPAGLLIDSGGNIISVDSRNDRIQLFSSDGQYQTTLKLNERIKRPSGICANRAGTQFYVSCYLAGCVRAFNIGY